MDAEKVKEIVIQAVKDCSTKVISPNWFEHLEREVNGRLEDASAAEHEGWKGLPWCGADTRRIVGCVPNTSAFCKYRCGELESGEAHCNYSYDEPAKDSEPVLTTKEAIRVFDTRTFEERFEEIEGSYWKRMEQTFKRLNNIGERLEKVDKELGIHMHYHAVMRSKQEEGEREAG